MLEEDFGSSPAPSQSLSRSGSIKRRRDHSWDSKWHEHLEKNRTENPTPEAIRPRRQPGKINPGSYWENTQRSELPPKSPSQKRKPLSLLSNGVEEKKTPPQPGVAATKTKKPTDQYDLPTATIEDVPVLPPASAFQDEKSSPSTNMSVVPPSPPGLALEAIGLPEAVSPVPIDKATASVKRRLVVRAESKSQNKAGADEEGEPECFNRHQPSLVRPTP